MCFLNKKLPSTNREGQAGYSIVRLSFDRFNDHVFQKDLKRH